MWYVYICIYLWTSYQHSYCTRAVVFSTRDVRAHFVVWWMPRVLLGWSFDSQQSQRRPKVDLNRKYDSNAWAASCVRVLLFGRCRSSVSVEAQTLGNLVARLRRNRGSILLLVTTIAFSMCMNTKSAWQKHFETVYIRIYLMDLASAAMECGSIVKRFFYPGTFPNGSGIKQLTVGIDQKGCQKRAKIGPKLARGGARRASGKQVSYKTLQVRKKSCISLTKLRICADLGWHLGTRWILKGSQNLTFLQEASIKWRKMRSRSVSQKHMKFW
jgi:hypothetical protein